MQNIVGKMTTMSVKKKLNITRPSSLLDEAKNGKQKSQTSTLIVSIPEGNSHRSVVQGITGHEGYTLCVKYETSDKDT